MVLFTVRARFKYSGQHRLEIRLYGVANFLQLPALMNLLNRLPGDVRLHLRVEELLYIDYACLTFLREMQKEFEAQGGQLHLHLKAGADVVPD